MRKKSLRGLYAFLNGNKLECAKQLGVTRATLYNRLKKAWVTINLPSSILA